jgi:RimJ/RimL family protein N-acetyltransferase
MLHMAGDSAVLIGETITLRPIRTEDFEALHTAAADPLIWEQHPDPKRHEREDFRVKFFDPAVASQMAYAVVDNATGQLIGSSRYYEYEPSMQEVAIGYTFLARSYWGGRANAQMKRLMLNRAFASGIKCVWFHIGKNNLRSRTAMEKVGGVLSHEAVKIMFGQPVDYVFYTISNPTIAPIPSSHSK